MLNIGISIFYHYQLVLPHVELMYTASKRIIFFSVLLIIYIFEEALHMCHIPMYALCYLVKCRS